MMQMEEQSTQMHLITILQRLGCTPQIFQDTMSAFFQNPQTQKVLVQLRKNIVAMVHADGVQCLTREKAIEVVKKQGEIQISLAPMQANLGNNLPEGPQGQMELGLRINMLQATAEDMLLQVTGVSSEAMAKTVNELKLMEDEEFKQLHMKNIQAVMQRVQGVA